MTDEPNGFAVIVGTEAIDAYMEELGAYNDWMRRQHTEARTAGELRAAPCPYPIISDHSVGACIDGGRCGCDAKGRVATLPQGSLNE